MLSFLARRMITVFLPTLLGMSILIFGAMHLIPGSYVDILLGVGQDISEEQRQAVVRQYGLDKPVPVQYLNWLGNVLTGDFGNSLKSGNSVSSEILSRLPVTLELAFLATVASLVLAIPAGILAAVYRGRWPDTLFRLLALVGLSVPNFLIAPCSCCLSAPSGAFCRPPALSRLAMAWARTCARWPCRRFHWGHC